MKHRVAGRKLGRTSAHRLAVLRNLASALFERERITTTLGKAKELRPFAERLLTLARRETLHARRQVLRHIRDTGVVAKLFDSLSARFAQRPGGYTRIIKLGPRRGDSAEMAIVELLGSEHLFTRKKKGGKGKGKPESGSAPTEKKETKAASEGTEEAPRKKRKAVAARESGGKTAGASKKKEAAKEKAAKTPAKKRGGAAGSKPPAAKKASKKSK